MPTAVDPSNTQKPKMVAIADPATPRPDSDFLETDFEVFEDGTLLELVGMPEGGIGLLLWGNGAPRVVPSSERAGRIYVPRPVPAGLIGSMRLPIAGEIEAAPADPLAETAACIPFFVDVPQNDLIRLAAFVLSTWFADRLSCAPMLAIIGPLASGKTTLCRVLSCLCRRPLLVANLSTAELTGLPLRMRPTLIMDETELTPDMCRLLRSSHAPGVPVLQKGKALDLYCPKVITSREPLRDQALATRCIQIVMSPTSKDINVLDVTRMEMLAADMQPKLLAMRLSGYERTETPRIDVEDLTPRMREVARALAFCVSSAELQSIMPALLETQDADYRGARSVEPEFFLIKSLLCFSDGDGVAVTVGNIGNIAEKFAVQQGEKFGLKARAVGPRLRMLGFSTRQLGSAGYGLYISEHVRTQIHSKGREYGLVSADGRCEFCKPRERNAAR